MSTLLYVAPANSIHSYDWIRSIGIENREIFFVSLYQPDKTLLDANPGIKMHYVDLPIPLVCRFVLTLLYCYRLVWVKKPSVVHGHTFGWHGLLASLLPKKRLILTAWGSDILKTGPSVIRNSLIQFMALRCDVATTDSINIKRKLLLTGKPAEEIELIQFGSDFSEIQRITSSVKQNPKKFKVISTRNHEPIYDDITLLKAVQILLPAFPHIQCVLYGEGSLTGDLLRFVQANHMEKHVVFKGKQPKEKLLRDLAQSSVYVSCALSDAGLAKSTVEAMAVGLPVIVTDVAENAHWVQHQVTGLLFEASSQQELARLLASTQKLANATKLARAGQKLVYEHFDSKVSGKKILKAYGML